ncbi:hypothetical protein ACHQM5_023516 [Ranunculus cassubicifolius]
MARRVKGKCARNAIKAEHRSGRTGAARIAHELMEKEPDVPVTRTQLYIALHTGKNDDACPSPERNETVEKVKQIASENPQSTFLDEDHDPVAQKQKQITSALGGEIIGLKALVKEHSKYIAELRGAQRSSGQCSNSVSASQENAEHNTHASQGTTDWIEKGCRLYSMRGEHVANGRALIGESLPNERDYPPENIETYDVLLDRVLMPNASSTFMDTLGEENIGSILTWPKVLTVIG